MIWLRRLSYCVVVLVILIGLVPALLMLYFPRSHRVFPQIDRPEKWGLHHAEEHFVSFPGDPDAPHPDALTLKVWVFKPEAAAKLEKLPQHSTIAFNSSNHNACIIVAHGHGQSLSRIFHNMSLISKAILPLVSAGFTVVAFDQRNHGYSTYYPPVTFGYSESHDINTHAHNIITRRRISLCQRLSTGQWTIGFVPTIELGFGDFGTHIDSESMGAATVLFAATRDSRIRAVVADCPWSNILTYILAWIRLVSPYPLDDLNFLPHLAKLKSPVYLTHGTLDRLVPVSEAHAIFAECSKTNCPIKFEYYELGHARASLVGGYHQKMVNFFEQHL